MIVAYSSSDSDDENDLLDKSKEERLFKAKKSQSKLKQIAETRKNLLSVSKIKNDSDDETVPEKKVSSKSKTGILSILPSPINAYTEAKLNKNFEKSLKSIKKPKVVKVDEMTGLRQEPIQFDQQSTTIQDTDVIDTKPKQSCVQNFDWNDIFKNTKCVEKKRFNEKDIEFVDLNDDDIIGDTTELFRDRRPGTSTLFKKDISKPGQMEKNKHKLTYLAYQAKQQEIEHQNTYYDYKPKKRTNRDMYGF